MTSCFLIILHPVSGDVLLGYKPHKKHWALPGGKCKKGETLLESLLRECREELAQFKIRTQRLAWLKPLRTRSGNECRYAVLITDVKFGPGCEEFSRTEFHPVANLPSSSTKTEHGVRRAQRLSKARSFPTLRRS